MSILGRSSFSSKKGSDVKTKPWPAAQLWAPRHVSLRLRPAAGLSSSMQTLSLSITPAQTAAWRKQIFQQLTERTKRELENFRHYEQAVEQVGGRRARPLCRH